MDRWTFWESRLQWEEVEMACLATATDLERRRCRRAANSNLKKLYRRMEWRNSALHYILVVVIAVVIAVVALLVIHSSITENISIVLFLVVIAAAAGLAFAVDRAFYHADMVAIARNEYRIKLCDEPGEIDGDNECEDDYSEFDDNEYSGEVEEDNDDGSNDEAEDAFVMTETGLAAYVESIVDTNS